MKARNNDAAMKKLMQCQSKHCRNYINQLMFSDQVKHFYLKDA